MPEGFLERAAEIAKEKAGRPAKPDAANAESARKKRNVAAAASWSCSSTATTARDNLMYRANGSAKCSQQVEQLAIAQCIDLWNTDDRWQRLGCGNWKIVNNVSGVTGYTYSLSCSKGRYYRAVSKWAASESSWNDANDDVAPYHPCIT